MASNNKRAIFIFLFLTTVSELNLAYAEGHDHGSFCNETVECESSNLLACQEGVCLCILPDSMVWDNNRNSCVSLVTEACGSLSMDTSEVVLACVENAFCSSQEGECTCLPTHFEVKGKCHPQFGFGAVCNLTSQCSSEKGLVCLENKTCGCDPLTSVDNSKFYDGEEKNRKCLGRPTNPCLPGGCVPNSVCNKIIKTCECEDGFETSKNKKVCVGQYNQSCDSQSNRFCKKDLSCVKGLCKCKNEGDQIFDKISKACVTLVGGTCDPFEETISCVPNAVCNKKEDGEFSSFFCQCEEGFVLNFNRTCDVGFGHPCSGVLEEWQCDRVGGLVCRDGFCECPLPTQIFDFEEHTCKRQPGSFCIRGRDAGPCVKNAYCNPIRGNLLPFGICQCEEDFTTDGKNCKCNYC